VNFDKPFLLGAEHINATPPGAAPVGLIRTFALNSIIDEFAVYSKALTAQQIATHFAQVPEPSTTLLIAWAFIGCFSLKRKRGK
jgi:hypothetical protein